MKAIPFYISDKTDIDFVLKPPIEFLVQPKDITASVGETVAVSISVSAHNTVTFKWQYKMADTTTWSSSTFDGNDTNTLYIPVATKRDGYYYRCKVTDSTGLVVYSREILLTVI